MREKEPILRHVRASCKAFGSFVLDRLRLNEKPVWPAREPEIDCPDFVEPPEQLTLDWDEVESYKRPKLYLVPEDNVNEPSKDMYGL